MPCEHKCRTKCGSGSWSGHQMSQNITKINNSFRACGTWFIVTSVCKIQKSMPICNLTPCKSTTEKGQVNLWPQKVKFSNWYSRLKMSLSEPVRSQDYKNLIFIFVPCPEMLKIEVCKNDVINRYDFWAVCFPKIILTWHLSFQMIIYVFPTYITGV